MTADEFAAKTGRAPTQDDLARVNCTHAGTILHRLCGWCLVHDTPRWECPCPIRGHARTQGMTGE
jgi:hypothetical protein